MPRRFKQCLGFYQVATRVPDVFKVPIPKEAQSVLSIFEVFNVNIAGLSLPLSCMGLGTYRQQMLFTILFPVVIALSIFVCSVVYASCSSLRGRGTSRAAKSDRKSPLMAGGMLALPHLLTLSFLVLPMVSFTAPYSHQSTVPPSGLRHRTGELHCFSSLFVRGV